MSLGKSQPIKHEGICWLEFASDSTKLKRPQQTSDDSLENSSAVNTDRRKAQHIKVKQRVKAQEVILRHILFWLITLSCFLRSPVDPRSFKMYSLFILEVNGYV